MAGVIGHGRYAVRLWALSADNDAWLNMATILDTTGECGWVLHQVSGAQFSTKASLYEGTIRSIEPGETLLTVERNSLEIWAGIVDTVDEDPESDVLSVVASDLLGEFRSLVVKDLLDTPLGGEYVERHAAAVLDSAAAGAVQLWDMMIRTEDGPNIVKRSLSPSSPTMAFAELDALADEGLDFFAMAKNVVLINRADAPTREVFKLQSKDWARRPVTRRSRAGYADRVWGVRDTEVLVSPQYPPADRSLVEAIVTNSDPATDMQVWTDTLLAQRQADRTSLIPPGPLRSTAAVDIQDLTPGTVGTLLLDQGPYDARSLEVRFSWEEGQDDPDNGKTGVTPVFGEPLGAPYRVSRASPEATQASVLVNLEDRLRQLETKAVIRS